MADSIYGAILTLGNAGILVYLVYYLPFHRKTINLIYCGFFAFSTSTAFIRFIAALSGGGINYAIAIIPVGIISCVAAVVFAHWRIRKITKIAKYFCKQFCNQKGIYYQ